MDRIEYIPCSNEFIAKYGITKQIRDAAASGFRAVPRYSAQTEAQADCDRMRSLVEQAKGETA